MNDTVSVLDKVIRAAPLIRNKEQNTSETTFENSRSLLNSFESIVKSTSASLSSKEKVKIESKTIAVVASKPSGIENLEITSFDQNETVNINQIPRPAFRNLSEIVETGIPFFGAIQIPSTVFTDSVNCQENFYSYVFRDGDFFFGTDDSGRGAKSAVLGAACGEAKIENLTKPVELSFVANEIDGGGSFRCAYWDVEQGVWLEHGVTTTSTFQKNGSTIISCSTNHLTNFALILDVSQTGSNPLALQIITWIGCGISLAGLFLTILSFSIFKKVRQKLVPKLLICLSLSLALTLILFLSLVEKTEPRVQCQVVAGLIQYFVLSTFCWSAVEGFHLYSSFVKVFRGGSDSRFFRKAFIFAAGIPAVIVAVTGSLKPEYYGNDKICMVHGLPFFLSMLLPICVILLGNTIVLALVLRGIKKAGKMAHKPQDDSSAILKNVKIAFACSILLGLTWMFGVFAVGELTAVFQWLFCIFNSLQGFFIFLFYTFNNQELKKEWLIMLRMRGGKKNVTSSGPATVQRSTTTGF